MANGCNNFKFSMEDFAIEDSVPACQGVSESIISCDLSDMVGIYGNGHYENI